MSTDPAIPSARPSGGVLDFIERVGNRLPEPALLFAILAGIVIAMSAIASAAGWSVQRVEPRVVDAGSAEPGAKPATVLTPVGEPITPRSLLTADGVYWMLSSMLRNFTGLPALGLIFVAMLGIGVAEKFGFFAALMRFLALLTPRRLLTPVIVLIGANSSVASDAGYIILPPLAAALYAAVGRPPLAGLAAAFAGVAGGFGGGFFPNGSDGALAGFAQDAARIIDPAYTVNILHNAYFKAGSAVVVMIGGWFVTDRIVEPRLVRAGAGGAAGVAPSADMTLHPRERRALLIAALGAAAVIGLFVSLIAIPGAPLHGLGKQSLANDTVLVQHAVTVAPANTQTTAAPSDVLTREPLTIVERPVRGRLMEPPGERWSHVIVPIIFFSFLTPGVIFGILTGALRTQKDFIEGLYHGVRSIVPVLVIAFFMAQFVNYFAYTRLDRMLAFAGGAALVRVDLPPAALVALFVLLVVFGDFAISGMLSKFGVLAPIFIPMFMMVGLSPELTTAAYRIGDSVVNVVTPLNSYLLVILAVLQKYRAGAGIGSLMSLMLPYSVVLFVLWTCFLLAWHALGWPLGVDGPLTYTPRAEPG